ncbi:hypothetical protein C8R45DRAFT_1045352 [Mycena sanguinolenta]|nr:hypothetical protein C8R45DRAFT_1045352 [Mycena sanguinolenta]
MVLVLCSCPPRLALVAIVSPVTFGQHARRTQSHPSPFPMGYDIQSAPSSHHSVRPVHTRHSPAAARPLPATYTRIMCIHNAAFLLRIIRLPGPSFARIRARIAHTMCATNHALYASDRRDARRKYGNAACSAHKRSANRTEGVVRN